MTDWTDAFLHWAMQPSPADVWLYRGQVAQYSEIIPAGLRESKRQLCYHSLYDINCSIARDIFRSSPVFHQDGLYPHVINDTLGLELEKFVYSVAGCPPFTLPKLSFPEIVRALAHHYGYATLFVDVSLSAVAAALFATHCWTSSGYLVKEQDEGIVLRWPASRRSDSRLHVDATTGGGETIQVIDISRVSPHMRRPHNQRAALAAPTRDPKPLYQPFRSPVSRMTFTDMAELPCCETFRIPVGGGHRLCEFDGVSMDAMFPDTIDLGYSYLTVIALLSMICAAEHDLDCLPMKDVLRGIRERELAIGRAVLDRECLRNVEGLRLPRSFSRMTAQEARLRLAALKSVAEKAVQRMGSVEDIELVQPVLRQRQQTLQTEAERRHSAFAEALRESGYLRHCQASELTKPIVTVSTPTRPSWLHDELVTRFGRVESILDTVEFVPVYALADRTKFVRHVEALPSTAAYEQRVRDQLEAQKRWLNCEFFNLTST